MHLSWRNFLLFNTARADLDQNNDVIQQRFSDQNLAPNEKFNILAEHKTLVVLTCNPIGKEVQATFFHHLLRDGFKQVHPDCVGLMGFGKNASAVRINPDTFFAIIKTPKPVPTMKSFLEIKGEDEFRNLQPEQSDKQVIRNKFAVLPPFLADALFELEEFDAARVAVKFLTKIRERHNIKNKEVISLDDQENDEDDDEDGSTKDETEQNNESNEEENEQRKRKAEKVNEAMNKLIQDHDQDIKTSEMTSSYHDTFSFLWSVQQGLKSHPGVALPHCLKGKTNKWVEEAHAKNLLRSLPQDRELPPPLEPLKAGLQLDNSLSVEFKNLARAISAKHLSDLREKKEGKSEKNTLRFEKLSTLKQNTITMFQVGPGHAQEDVDVMTPPPNMLVCLNQKSAGDVAGTLHHHAARAGVMANFESGLAAAIHQGNIASSPRATDINNCTVFFIHPGNKKQSLSARDSLLYQMKAEYGKLDQADVEALISMKPFAPFDFASYLHMLKGMEFLCTFLGGEFCYSAQAWRMAKEHAEMNEFIYADKKEENAMLFASLLNDFHRRHMTFIHSPGDKQVTSMAIEQMDFSKITNKIDCFEHVVNRPSWIPKRDPKDRHKQENDNNKRQKPNNGFKARVETINNAKQDPALKLPTGMKFGDVFRDRDGVEAVDHPDGTKKCNNWHYRGWCIKDCRYGASSQMTRRRREKST